MSLAFDDFGCPFMSRRASPRSPPPSSHADDVPILNRSPPTRESSGLQSSLLRFVARESPASVRLSWDGVRAALGLRDDPPPPSFFSSPRSSPRCSTASCDAPRDEDDSSSAESFRDSGWFSERFLFALFARLDSVESDVAQVTRRLASLERWRLSVDAQCSGTSRAERSASSSPSLSSEVSASRLSLVALVEKRRLEARFRDTRNTPRGRYIEGTADEVHDDNTSRSSSSNIRRNIHRARVLLHPSPPESPEEAFSFSFSSDDGDERFAVRALDRSRSSAHSVSSVESIDESDDDGGHDRSTFSFRWSTLIEDVREVRAEVARLKSAPFFRGEDDVAR